MATLLETGKNSVPLESRHRVKQSNNPKIIQIYKYSSILIRLSLTDKNYWQ